MSRKHVVLVGCLLVAGCSGLFKRDRPVDINENMPDVARVVASVQKAIDATASNPHWGPSEAYQAAQRACDEKRTKAAAAHGASCAAAYDAARTRCRRETGPNAQLLCEDHLRQAREECGDAPGAPQACAVAAQLRPPQIKVARLQFTAASSSNVDAGASLKLISAKMARKGGRIGSYELVLVPNPQLQSSLQGLTQEGTTGGSDIPSFDTLRAALTVALNAAVAKDCPAGECDWQAAPQLVLQSAKYSFEISYETSAGGGFTWTVSPLKITDGSFNIGSEAKLGNVLTVEITR